MVEIRSIVKEDFESIASLSNELGYIINPQDLLVQLKTILKDGNHHLFGAIKDNKLVGYIHSTQVIGLTSLPFTEIMALIVCEKERGNGIGKQLVKKIENVCSDKKLRVRCNSKRELAHKFYYNMNFSLNKEQKVFEKAI
jgi:GNAT superfamily N-acetyltransferase